MLLLAVLADGGVSAEPEIHRCLQADGTIAFQQLPCREATTPEPDAIDATDGEDRGERNEHERP